MVWDLNQSQFPEEETLTRGDLTVIKGARTTHRRLMLTDTPGITGESIPPALVEILLMAQDNKNELIFRDSEITINQVMSVGQEAIKRGFVLEKKGKL